MDEDFVVRMHEDAGPAELSLLAALQAIMDAARPGDVEKDASAHRPLRPNRKLVAERAGVHRNALSGRNCAYPRVVAEIGRAQEHVDLKRLSRSVRREIEASYGGSALRRDNAGLRERNADLTSQRNAAYTSAACCTILARALERATRANCPDLQRIRRAAEAAALTSVGPFGQSHSESRPEANDVTVRD